MQLASTDLIRRRLLTRLGALATVAAVVLGFAAAMDGDEPKGPPGRPTGPAATGPAPPGASPPGSGPSPTPTSCAGPPRRLAAHRPDGLHRLGARAAHR
ncbi:hypothetical protein NKH77_06650 [Streptomyces sp. M19]